MNGDRAKADAIVARCRSCQGLTYASVVDESRGLTLDTDAVARLVAAGYNIEHTTVGYVRAAAFCDCERPRRARPLLPENQDHTVESYRRSVSHGW